MRQSEDPRLDDVVAGAVWRHKRERWRRVTITGLHARGGRDWDSAAGSERFVGVVRNTSRRRQAISEATLLRDYEFAHMERGR